MNTEIAQPKARASRTASAVPELKHTRSENSAVKAIKRLALPWQTSDPFIFSVHHDDHFPAGNKQMGPAASLEGRNIGEDFSGKDGWSMYHGDVVLLPEVCVMTPLAAMPVEFDAEAASGSNLVAASMADPLRAMLRKSLLIFIT